MPTTDNRNRDSQHKTKADNSLSVPSRRLAIQDFEKFVGPVGKAWWTCLKWTGQLGSVDYLGHRWNVSRYTTPNSQILLRLSRNPTTGYQVLWMKRKGEDVQLEVQEVQEVQKPKTSTRAKPNPKPQNEPEPEDDFMSRLRRISRS